LAGDANPTANRDKGRIDSTINKAEKERIMKTYNELKKQHSKELDEFQGIFFAFSNEQFAEGMKRVSLGPDDTRSIFSLGAGGYIRKDRADAWHAMFKKHTAELKEMKANDKMLLDALVYELNNHEYGYTYDSGPALEALNILPGEIDPKLLKKACCIASQEAIR
jgi:hypothetical protein